MSDSFQSFSLRLSRARCLLVGGSLTLLGLVGCLLLSGMVLPRIVPPHWGVGLILLLTSGYQWYRFLGTASRVQLFGDGKMEFISVVKVWRLSVYGLRSIEPQRRSNLYLIVRHQEGTIRLFNRVQGLPGCLETVKSRNQAIAVQGIEFNQKQGAE